MTKMQSGLASKHPCSANFLKNRRSITSSRNFTAKPWCMGIATKAIMGMKDEEAVLSRLGLDYRALDSGCCGMAGAFGFEKDHYDVSIKVGERALLPTVRSADKDTLIIADGFSCREQIDQTTDRHT